MRKAAVLGAIVGALGFGFVASSAVAAPVGSEVLRIEPASTVERVDHRRVDRRYDRYRDYRYRDYRYRDSRYRDYRYRHHHRHVGLFPFLLPFIVLALVH
jgi:hypothetical protein